MNRLMKHIDSAVTMAVGLCVCGIVFDIINDLWDIDDTLDKSDVNTTGDNPEYADEKDGE